MDLNGVSPRREFDLTGVLACREMDRQALVRLTGLTLHESSLPRVDFCMLGNLELHFLFMASGLSTAASTTDSCPLSHLK